MSVILVVFGAGIIRVIILVFIIFITTAAVGATVPANYNRMVTGSSTEHPYVVSPLAKSGQTALIYWVCHGQW